MSSVVFFRAVNVAGHQTFQPGKLAKELTGLDVVNIGAAGTFVVRADASPGKIRAAILKHLPFKPELIISPAADVLALARGNWFAGTPTGKDITRFVSVLQQPPEKNPSLPFDQPAGKQWEVRLLAITGPFILSIRHIGQTYSNAIVEKAFGVPATTRNWNTLERIQKVLSAL